MGVRHSTVRRRIDALEHAVGLRLVHRRAQGVVLTDATAKLVPLAVRAERAVAAFATAAQAHGGDLRLAVPSGFAAILAPFLVDLGVRYPDLAITLVVGNNPADLRAGEADIALRMVAVRDPDLLVRRVGAAGWSLYASPASCADHPANRDPVDLTGHRVIGLHGVLDGPVAARWLDAHSRQSDVVMCAASMADLAETAAQGLGVALLPCMLGDAAKQLERLTPLVLARPPAFLACRRDLVAHAQGRRVVHALVAAMRSAGPALRGDVR